MDKPGTAPQREPESLGHKRVPVLNSSLGLVEHVRRGSAPAPQRVPENGSPIFRVILPYRGLVVVHAARDVILGDSSNVLFCAGVRPYSLSVPVPDGYAELCITPDPETLAELTHVTAPKLLSLPLFFMRRRPADLRMQFLRGSFLHRVNNGISDALGAEEMMLEVLRCAFQVETPRPEPSRATRRLIQRTKEYVEWSFSRSFRLADAAHAVGATPAYLTAVFRRFEGVPLHRYVIQARLARALVELPHTDDLTTLALNLGFSSHSHFTSAFRRTFGCTPSEFRTTTRTARSR